MAISTEGMTNQELADTFELIANLLDIKGEIVYKTLAYRRVAENLRVFPEDINTVFKENRLVEVPGVGKAIAEKITELLQTGQLGFLERLKEEVPLSLIDLLQVPDVGPRKVALFWKQAGVTNLAELETAARAGKLRLLPGMGEKSEARILAGIEALGRRSTRMLLGAAWPVARRWLDWLRQVPGVQRAEAAGSLRRWRSTIGDLDLVAVSDHPADVMDAFIHHAEVIQVLGQGENKSSIELANGLKLQLWIQPRRVLAPCGSTLPARRTTTCVSVSWPRKRGCRCLSKPWWTARAPRCCAKTKSRSTPPWACRGSRRAARGPRRGAGRQSRPTACPARTGGYARRAARPLHLERWSRNNRGDGIRCQRARLSGFSDH